MATKIKQAVILAGGLGTRMRPLTDTMPKPMIPVAGRPFLEYLIELLKKNGVTEVILLLGYLPEKIMDHFGDGARYGLRIRYRVTPVEYDTGARLKEAEPALDEHFLLLYCDNYWPLDLAKLSAFYDEKAVTASVVAYTNKDHMTKNNMLVDADGMVVKYDRTRASEGLNCVEAGFFILSKSVLPLIPKGNFNFEEKVLLELIEKHQLAGYRTDHRYYSIGSIERLPIVEEFFQPRKIALIDRDGVINQRAPKAYYVRNWDEFIFLPRAIEGLKLLADHGYELYVVTNQPGVARGMVAKEDLDVIHANLITELKKHGVALGGIYACLHGWDEGCDCRKPKPGLLFQAANEHHFDVTKAIMIGDDERDIAAGQAAGARTILVDEKEGLFPVVQSLIKE